MLLAALLSAALAAPAYRVARAADDAAPAACRPEDDRVALVVIGRRPGASAWGHAGLRFLTCEDGVPADVLIEAYRFNRHTWRNLSVWHPAARLPEGRRLLQQNRGRLYVSLVEQPTRSGEYAYALAQNRDIWEAWLAVPPAGSSTPGEPRARAAIRRADLGPCRLCFPRVRHVLCRARGEVPAGEAS